MVQETRRLPEQIAAEKRVILPDEGTEMREDPAVSWKEPPSPKPVGFRPAARGRLGLVLAVLFLAGMAYGAYLSGFLDSQTSSLLENLARGYLAGRAESSFGSVFLHALVSSAMLAGAVFLSGFSAAGQPFAVFFLLFRAVGFGMSMGHFYAAADKRGILLALLLLLPAGVLSGYALLLSCRESIRMSNRFFRAMILSSALKTEDFRLYVLKFTVIAGILLVSALLDAGCAALFRLLE